MKPEQVLELRVGQNDVVFGEEGHQLAVGGPDDVPDPSWTCDVSKSLPVGQIEKNHLLLCLQDQLVVPSKEQTLCPCRSLQSFRHLIRQIVNTDRALVEDRKPIPRNEGHALSRPSRCLRLSTPPEGCHHKIIRAPLPLWEEEQGVQFRGVQVIHAHRLGPSRHGVPCPPHRTHRSRGVTRQLLGGQELVLHKEKGVAQDGSRRPLSIQLEDHHSGIMPDC
mmetsp:Transcript_475/g.1051  ORF Transcript_475/g.1051 Transcript_475/m.1051 type:complete len:221 (-) Transcript_475:362-1024(-)